MANPGSLCRSPASRPGFAVPLLYLAAALLPERAAAQQNAAPKRLVDNYSGVILICNPAVGQKWGVPVCKDIAEAFDRHSVAAKVRHAVGMPGKVDSVPEHPTPEGPIETQRSVRLLIWFDAPARAEAGWQMKLQAYDQVNVGDQRFWRNVYVQSAIFTAGREAEQAPTTAPLLVEGFFDLVTRAVR